MDNTEDFDALLSPRFAPANDTLRSALLQKTLNVLRRRRRLKRAALAAALAACYAAGLATMYWFTPPGEPVRESQVENHTRENRGVDTPRSPERSPQVSGDAPDAIPDVSAQLLERWSAFVSEDKRAEYLRTAGDRYLTVESDPQSAIRCYHRFLDIGTAEDLSISAEKDSWLLMSLKQDRLKGE